METVYHFNAQGYNSHVAKIKQAETHFQNLLDEFNTLGLFKIETKEQLGELATGVDVWIKEKLAEGIQPTKIFGISISRKKAVELLELPDFEKLNELSEQAKPYINDLPYLALTGSKVLFDEKQDKAIRDTFTVYAKYDAERKAIAAHKKMASLLEDFMAVFPLYKGSPLSDLFTFESGGKVSAREYFYVEKGWAINDFQKRQGEKP